MFICYECNQISIARNRCVTPASDNETKLITAKRLIMITARIDELELRKGWSDGETDVAFNFGLVAPKANGSATSQLMYVTLEPGKSGGRHVHSAEEILVVLEGTVQL